MYAEYLRSRRNVYKWCIDWLRSSVYKCQYLHATWKIKGILGFVGFEILALIFFAWKENCIPESAASKKYIADTEEKKTDLLLTVH